MIIIKTNTTLAILVRPTKADRVFPSFVTRNGVLGIEISRGTRRASARFVRYQPRMEYLRTSIDDDFNRSISKGRCMYRISRRIVNADDRQSSHLPPPPSDRES